MENRDNSLHLSKSLFVKGVRCKKALYLEKHHRDLKDPIPASREALFESGSEVGMLARGLFPRRSGNSL